jgi:hypothetical protein
MTAQASDHVTLREALTNSLRYWEPRRLIYNLALLLVVAAAYVAGLPASRHAVSAESMLVLFILAVLANVAYCAAYVPDLVLQYSAFRSAWLRGRWMLLVLGTLFASAIAYFFVAGMFGLAGGAWW